MATINLSKGGFTRRVANIELSPNDWKFLGDRPALIDFHAKWCGPCKRLSPIIDELAEDFNGKVDVYKVNVDDEPELANYFNIRTVPTLVFVPMNDMPKLVSGAYPKQEIAHAIDTLLLK
ncbi:MAG: thioredoxin domain-containing protein [Muribaculaceae bacterium]|jgi:thioredoxin|nr:thioredoxin fold domain-containing protein [Muribaculaceae bacterium]MEE1337922.1 thioredoxin domain-containing protein [Muribaculaceae bacterium]